MRYVILGSRGQLGKEFLRILDGEEVFEYDLHNIDITDNSQLVSMVEKTKPGVVINCAAYNQVDLAEEKSDLAYSVNRDAPQDLARICKERNIKLVHYSTNYVFDGNKSEPYEINDPPNPISVYARSKFEGERGVLENNEKALVIRTSWVFGEGVQNFIHKLNQWSQSRSVLKIVDDEVSTPTSTVDLAEATLKLLEEDVEGLVHVTNLGSCSRYEWAEHILSELGWEGELEKAKLSDFNLPARRPKHAVLSLKDLPDHVRRSIRTWKQATSEFISHAEMI